MKLKIKSSVAHGVIVHINNYYNEKPYRTIQHTDGSVISFFSKEDYDAFKQYQREEQK